VYHDNDKIAEKLDDLGLEVTTNERYGPKKFGNVQSKANVYARKL